MVYCTFRENSSSWMRLLDRLQHLLLHFEAFGRDQALEIL